MNAKMQERWPWVEGSQGMRGQIMDILSDADLSFNPGGQNKTLGALCREIGEIEYAYIQSFKTFKQDFTYRSTEPGLDKSVAGLKAWFKLLDDEMKAVVSGLSDEDMAKNIDRSGYMTPPPVQLEIYLQALLIFFGKAVIFLLAMNKPLPKDIQFWIA